MNQKIEQLYQEIGRDALGIADSLAGRLLVYAEVQKGVVSADVFYVNTSGVVRYQFSPKPLQAVIYSFWEQWKAEPSNREWRIMSYLIDGGKFSLDLVYPDQIDENEELSDRRPRAIKKYFGDTKVDYSRPKAQ